MNIQDIAFWGIQTVVSLMIGIIGYFIKDLRKTMRTELERMNSEGKETKKELEQLKRDFNDYKEAVPYKFVLHEEFNRVVGNFDRKLDEIMKFLREGK